ncbi:hypothetical protein AAFF_G00228670 [Aldrovandia affinis]|uniref:Uncharacterized protein n=1 Tax=Aldrovandia affinis TaxID=143900 RepID=A0AAD7WU12_9TELE|nr:hypothetical protein AAFF_G00228670 [Aldrovandia affinis]
MGDKACISETRQGEAWPSPSVSGKGSGPPIGIAEQAPGPVPEGFKTAGAFHSIVRGAVHMLTCEKATERETEQERRGKGARQPIKTEGTAGNSSDGSEHKEPPACDGSSHPSSSLSRCE